MAVDPNLGHYVTNTVNIPPTTVKCKCGNIYTGADCLTLMKVHMDVENAPEEDTEMFEVPGSRLREMTDDIRKMGDLLESAWGLIANAGWDASSGDVSIPKTTGWHEAAVRWREDYFALTSRDGASFVLEKISIEKGEPSETILVIARSFRYVSEWCLVHGINARSPRVKWARTGHHLQGIKDAYYVDLGTDDQEFRVLLEQLKALGHIKPLLTPIWAVRPDI